MLRQVYIYYKNEIIFSYFFAQAYDSSTLNSVISEKLQSYITSPLEGKVFSKPIFEYQSHFGVFNNVFILFVTDMADRPKIISKEVERAGNLFTKSFPNPLDIKNPSVKKEEFNLFVKETHYYLHPKIALIGPIGAGKSTITQILAESIEPDKRIMNFALYYQVKIGEIYLDLWDFIDFDDFSPLWNNYIRGSDIIFLVLDGCASSINEQKLKFFHQLIQREGKYSRWAIILTHQLESDYISADEFKSKFSMYENANIYELDLSYEDAKSKLAEYFSDTIGLKKTLPPEFKTQLQNANEAVGEANYSIAISLLKDLCKMCEDYQEFGYLEVFKNKISELEEKLRLQKIEEERDKKKIKAPKKIDFDSFKGVKALPLEQNSFAPPPPPAVSPVPKKNTREVPTIESSPQEKTFEEEILSDIDSSNPFFGNNSIKSKEKQIITNPSKSSPIDTSILKTGPSDNPFFHGLNAFTNEEEMQNLNIESGAPIDNFEFKIHKVDPIEVRRLTHKDIKEHRDMENISTPNLDPHRIREGETRKRALTLERSPFISNEIKASHDIKRKNPIQQEEINNPLQSFDIQQADSSGKIESDAIKMQMEIKNLGGTLSLELCEKFIEQLRQRLLKTNLTEIDIKKAASLFILQKKRKESAE